MRKKKIEDLSPDITVISTAKKSKEELEIMKKTLNDPELKPYINWKLTTINGGIVEINKDIKDDGTNLVLKQNLSQLYLQLIIFYNKQISQEYILNLHKLGLDHKLMELYVICLVELEKLISNPQEDSMLRTKSKIWRLFQLSDKKWIPSYKDKKALDPLINKLEKLKMLIKTKEIETREHTILLKKPIYAPYIIHNYKIGTRETNVSWDTKLHINCIKNYLYNKSTGSYDEDAIKSTEKMIVNMTAIDIREQAKILLKKLNFSPHDFLELFSEEQYNGHMNFYKDLVRIKKDGKSIRKYKYIPGHHKYGKRINTY